MRMCLAEGASAAGINDRRQRLDEAWPEREADKKVLPAGMLISRLVM